MMDGTSTSPKIPLIVIWVKYHLDPINKWDKNSKNRINPMNFIGFLVGLVLGMNLKL